MKHTHQYQYQQQQSQLEGQHPKTVLPPITSILQNFPTFQLPIYTNAMLMTNDQNNQKQDSRGIQMRSINTSEDENKNINIFMSDKTIENQQNQQQTIEKTPQYTLADDLLILKTINSYYGTAFHGRVPWSFWQTFRKVTGNKRSPSSLYHHWNGAMKRKYGSFLNHGKINECISWIETAMESGRPAQKENSSENGGDFAGMPLAHNWSFPPAPIDQNDINNQKYNIRSMK